MRDFVEFLAYLALSTLTLGKVLYQENFEVGWETRWNQSKWRIEQQGQFLHSKGKWSLPELSYGIQTSTDMKFYELSTVFDEVVNVSSGPIVLQFSVKFEQSTLCGGGYIKLLNPKFNTESFGGETPALIIFGPDICGNNNRIHIIIDSHGRGELWRKSPEAPIDKVTHFYTLSLSPDGTYALYVDCVQIERGKISDEWELDYNKTFMNFVIGGIGIDVWQVKAGTLFDNFMITDSLQEAIEYAKEFLGRQIHYEEQLINEAKLREKEQEEEYKRLRESKDTQQPSTIDLDDEKDDL